MRTLYCIVLLCISGSLYSGRGPKKHMKRLQWHAHQDRMKFLNKMELKAAAEEITSSEKLLPKQHGDSNEESFPISQRLYDTQTSSAAQQLIKKDSE
jgi:hypothetical protein